MQCLYYGRINNEGVRLMQHPITKQTIRFILTERFDYLKAGEVYRGTPYRTGRGARIDRDDEGLRA